ncbi:MAG TPA: DNA-binding protein [Thermoplasmatales archaeon]|nr:DNA-binding protein [Thermoplasmatales archaeon]
MDDELEAIKRRKLEQLKKQLAYQQAMEQQEEIEKAEIEEERRRILALILTSEARERLARIRMARPEFARAIEDQLILLAQSGRIRERIDDKQLKALLARIAESKRDIKIERRGL